MLLIASVEIVFTPFYSHFHTLLLLNLAIATLYTEDLLTFHLNLKIPGNKYCNGTKIKANSLCLLFIPC